LANFNAIIIIIEINIPTLITNYSPIYKMKKININEELYFDININTDLDLSQIDFTSAIIYDYDIEGIYRFNYK